GQIADDRRTVFTLVVTKMKEHQGGQWKAVSAQNTDVVPGGPETHVNSPQGQTAVRYRTYYRARRRFEEIKPPSIPNSAPPAPATIKTISCGSAQSCTARKNGRSNTRCGVFSARSRMTCCIWENPNLANIPHTAAT